MGWRRFHHWWHSAFVLCAYGLVSASAETEYCHSWEASTWPVECWLCSGIHSYCNWMGQHESKLFTSFVQASRNLRIDAWLSWKARSTLKDASRLHHGKNIPNPLKSCWCKPARQAHLKKMSKRACVRTPLGMRSCRSDVRSPAPAWYRLGSKIQVHHWVSRIDWTKIIPRASLECRTCNISTEFMKLGRCEDGQLSCCTFVKLDLCPKRRTHCFQGWDLSLGSFHANSILRGPPGMVHRGSAEHCECQTWKSKTFLGSFTDQLAGGFSSVYF